MELSKEAEEKMKEIQALEDKYGLIIFRGGLTHMVDVGHSNLDDDAVEKELEQIMEQGEADKANDVKSFVTPGFMCEILRCSTDLTKFTIWTLFAYIKKYLVVDI